MPVFIEHSPYRPNVLLFKMLVSYISRCSDNAALCIDNLKVTITRLIEDVAEAHTAHLCGNFDSLVPIWPNNKCGTGK